VTEPAQVTAPAERAEPPAIGTLAPDFALKSQHGELVSLAGFRGVGSVLLVFYPFAFSRICTGELAEIRDDLGGLRSDAVQVLGVSCDPVHSLRAFAEAQGYAFPLLSDFWPHGAAARAYGVFNDTIGAAVRGSFLVDSDGVVRWSVVHGLGEARDLAGYHEALASI
jgi:peroxiredoxin